MLSDKCSEAENRKRVTISYSVTQVMPTGIVVDAVGSAVNADMLGPELVEELQCLGKKIIASTYTD